MPNYHVLENQTALDVALTLSGSLAGFPAVLAQLPVGERIGFEAMPELWEDVADIGQTWTPDIAGMDLELSVPVYLQEPLGKAPYTTDLFAIQPAIDGGNFELEYLLTPITLDRVKVGTNLRGRTIVINTEVPRGDWGITTETQYYLLCNNTDPATGKFEGLRATIGTDPTTPWVQLTTFFEARWGNELQGYGGNWYYQQYTIANDKDYIVTSNNLPAGDATKWGFENITLL